MAPQAAPGTNALTKSAARLLPSKQGWKSISIPVLLFPFPLSPMRFPLCPCLPVWKSQAMYRPLIRSDNFGDVAEQREIEIDVFFTTYCRGRRIAPPKVPVGYFPGVHYRNCRGPGASAAHVHSNS